MKILISPAKKLNDQKTDCKISSTQPAFLEDSQKIINTVKSMSAVDLSNLMNISDSLASLNYERFQSWRLPITEKNGKQALFSFQGDVYKSMDVDSFNKEDLLFANENLRILSGLYGLLRPSDLILDYRLEMGTRLQVEDAKNLYDFWKNNLTKYLLEEIHQDSCIVNLASDEYFKVLNIKEIRSEIIYPVFQDLKNGKFKVVSFFAKKARGSMCNFIIKNKITSKDDLKSFQGLGYRFYKEEEGAKRLIFTRE